MASNYIVVDVLRAAIIWTKGKPTPNCCVELTINQQSFTTSVKRGSRFPVWNERLYFDVGPDYFRPSHGLEHIEVRIYNVNVDGDTRRLLGTLECNDVVLFGFTKCRAHWLPWTASTTGAEGMILMKGSAMENSINPMDNFTGRQSFCASANNASDPLASLSEADQSAPLQLQMDVPVIPQEISPSFKSGWVVEEMRYLFVRVIKAHDLPDIDVNGSLDAFVEVIFGSLKGITHTLPKNKHPEWNTTFAFPFMHANKDLDGFTVIVKDKDIVSDETVGELHFALAGYSASTDILAEPTRRYPLRDRNGRKITDEKEEPHLTVAFCVGSQAHRAYRDARIISDNIVSLGVPIAMTSAEVYASPRQGLVRVTIIGCHGISMDVVDEHTTEAASSVLVEEKEVFIGASIGAQMVRTRAVKELTTADGSYFWNEDLMLVVDTSIDDFMIIDVKVEAGDACEEKLIGRIVFTLSMIERRDHGGHLAPPKWYKVEGPALRGPSSQGARDRPRLCVGLTEEAGYHVPCGGYHSTYWSTDSTLPADRDLQSNRPIGWLELGILRASGLPPRQDGKPASTTNPYSLARYCGRWARTRTVINSLDPVFNEQWRWDVYETATVLTVGLFDNCQVQLKGKASPEVANNVEDRRLGKVRIRISGLENGRTYAHSYPLAVLQHSGVSRTGELHLAVRLRFSSEKLTDMARAYSRPLLPKMHYMNPLSVGQLLHLQEHAIQILASRLKDVESPLRTEVVEYMCGAGEGPNLWSIRKSKANMLRILEAMAGLVSFVGWFQLVRTWSNPTATLLVHAIFALALWFHTLVLPSLLMSLSLVTIWSYRKRPTCPSYIDLKLSQVDTVTPDDLKEEFDACLNKDKTGQAPEAVAARYDRLRRIAGRVQGIMGDLASRGERIQALVSWTDRRATAFFELFALTAAVMLYFVPLKFLVAVAGFYIMRHPMLRWERSNSAANFLWRLPSKDDVLL